MFQIFHTNDVHSAFEALASLQTVLVSQRREGDLLLDAGDFHDFKSILLQGTQGRAGKRILSAMNYDAVAIGNNEGYSSVPNLEAMSEDDVPLLSCNLVRRNGEELPFIRKSCIIQKKDQRFLIIGVSPYYSIAGNDSYNVFFALDDLKVLDPVDRIKSEINAHQGNYDFIILLSHLGLTFDQQIVMQIPELDIIIGGHSHSKLEKPLIINDCVIHQAGAYAQSLGRISFDIQSDQLILIDSETIEIKTSPDPSILDLLAQEQKLAIEVLSEPLLANHALDFDPIQENRLMNFLCDALVKHHPCDFAMINHGIISQALPDPITKLSLIEACPSPLNPSLLRLKGHQIKTAYQQSLDHNYCMKSGRGPGFRGFFIGALTFSHAIRIQDDRILFNDQELEDNRIYHIMSSDYLQRGSGYPSLAIPDEETIFLRGYIRDVLLEHLHDENLHASSRIKRKVKL